MNALSKQTGIYIQCISATDSYQPKRANSTDYSKAQGKLLVNKLLQREPLHL